MKNSLAALREVSKQQEQKLRKITNANNLTISEWRLLLAINGQANTQEKLSRTMNLDTSTLSRQLKRLVEKDMVHKKAIGKDKRQLVYEVDDNGKIAIKNIDIEYNKLKSYIFDQWTDEEKNMLKILLNRLETSIKKTSKWSE